MDSVETPPAAAARPLRAWESYRATAHFGSLDGLRCLSIFGVIWQHGPGWTGTGLGARGYMGVPLFFAISGFLITTLLLRERERNGAISLPKFYWRRSLRIFPLYFAVLAAYCLLIYIFARGTPAAHGFYANLPYFLTYTSNWFVGTFGTFAFAWSLATEEQFYSTWPSILRYLGPARAAGVLGTLLALTLAGSIYWHGAAVDSPGFVITRNVPMSILWGCAAALALHYPQGFRFLWNVLGYRWSAAVLLILILAILSEGQNNVLVHFLFAALVAACVIREDHILAPLLRQRLVVHIGVISYGMYLLHGLVYDLLARFGSGFVDRGSIACFVLALAATIGLATLSFRFYETPFLRMKSRLPAGAG
jgi:peptidoglycan/LPS O-acetylase OafA/YrhL